MARKSMESTDEEGPLPTNSPSERSLRIRPATQTDERTETAKILRNFFRNIGFDLQQYEDPYPQELDQIARNRIMSWNLDDKRTAHCFKLLPTVASGTQKQYAQASIEVKTFITLYTICLFYIDDLVVKEPEKILPELQKLCKPVTSARPKSDSTCSEPCLLLWSELVASEAHLHYGPYATGAIQKGFVEFLMGSIIEARFPHGLQEDPFSCIPSTAAHFLRDKAGSGEVYAHFMFPTHLVPEDKYLGKYFVCVRDMMDWIDFTNDILSFYKENVDLHVGVEENTYIQNRARCEGKTPLEVLRNLCNEVVKLTESIRRGLKGEKVLEDIWENYLNGYILFHACDQRYRLRELGFVFERESPKPAP
ncbi:uncharacterized protein A1O5_06327 [Cladophialophora psammophila CBS 110553]|uniref:Trichodiene synthase n=1 Tax=Cladophialophora psammophila CBS 110553 TaxID=1182543 RepID=W9XIR3_9EURO|nr:uncharacterized protein A1O5_06327 [Cladophialophora psammophila CBS 110553]EXJ70259.1 hypothetical protein A1O5_06327 [Cladophialophora psammophila CBS 110553]